MPPIPVIPAIEAGASAVAALGQIFGIFSNKSATKAANATNLQIARETNAANAQINADSLEAQKQMQAAQNAFNSETAQAQRMRAAGLNPANMGVSSSVTGSSSVPSSIPAQAAQVVPEYTDIAGWQGLGRLGTDIAQIVKSNNEAQSIALGNQYQLETYQSRLDEQMHRVRLLLAQINDSRASTREKRAATSLLLKQAEQLSFTNSLNQSSYNDLLMQRQLQTRVLQGQLQAQNDEHVMSNLQQASMALSMELSKHTDQRETARLTADISRIAKECQMLTSVTNLNSSEYQYALRTMEERIKSLRIGNKGATLSNTLSEKTLGLTIDRLKQDIRESKERSTLLHHQSSNYDAESKSRQFLNYSLGVSSYSRFFKPFSQ